MIRLHVADLITIHKEERVGIRYWLAGLTVDGKSQNSSRGRFGNQSHLADHDNRVRTQFAVGSLDQIHTTIFRRNSNALRFPAVLARADVLAPRGDELLRVENRNLRKDFCWS